ncbi:spiro-SPASM protein [Spirochaeta lutea]|uniref:Radical SAM core domain-containing protein n=1 Tax=Spirochaeta lutea TaxID=1480694 RepID=A0A098R0R5_9SPIO|nr:spiro-SPASM protein [Spirochaeta lutea]KGE73760.1 hypothetical protein DC28_00580 [Spirochaeta lutea]
MDTDRTTMENHLCILLPAILPYWELELHHGSAKDYLKRAIESLASVSHVSTISLLFVPTPETEQQRSQTIKPPPAAADLDWSWCPVPYTITELSSDSWHEALTVVATTKPTGTVSVFWGDSPFLQIQVTKDLQELHSTYRADFTFADGYPPGTAPELLNPDTIPSLLSLSYKHPSTIDRTLLFGLIQQDINAYQIETLLSDFDFRPYRLELNTSTRRNYLLCKKLSAGLTPEVLKEDPREFINQIRSRQKDYRTLPAYFSIQISAQCPQQCSYCPYPRMNPGLLNDTNYMPLDKALELFQRLAEWSPESVISLSPLGEPSTHPDIYRIISYIDRHLPQRLLIVTSGIGWNPEEIKRLVPTLKKTQWIISLDAVSEEEYQTLRGTGFHEAMSFTQTMLALSPADVYVQAVRLKDREEQLLAFYQYWKGKTENIIIQKYANQGGLLPDRKAVDLRPLKRLPCWHLMRDFTVLLDGSVPLCEQSMGNHKPMGNIFKEEPKDIWDRITDPYHQHCDQNYPDVCRDCDEYYTYNF